MLNRNVALTVIEPKPQEYRWIILEQDFEADPWETLEESVGHFRSWGEAWADGSKAMTRYVDQPLA